MRSLKHLTLCFAILLCCGCAAKKVELTKTGFLTNYDQLASDEKIKGMMIFRNGAVNIHDTYTKVKIMPVEIILAPEAKEKFKDEDKAKLTAYFHKRLEERIAKKFELTEEAGPGVLLLRTAITNLLPNKVYLNLHWTTTLYGAGIGGASIEAELVDSQTNERIIAFIDAKKGQRFNYTKGLSKWGHTQEVLEKWADILVQNIVALDINKEVAENVEQK